MSHHASKAVKPGSPAFKLEALRQAKLITTVINDSTIQPKGSTSTLSNFGSENLLFLTVKDQTLAEVLQDAERGDRKSLDAVKFGNSAVSLKKSSSETVKVIGKDSGSFQMSVKPGSTGAQIYGQDYRSGIDFPNGRFNWNYKENLLGFLDLTYSNNRYADIESGSLRGALVNVDSITGMTGASGSASGPALAFGFYQILDEKGTVFDPLTMSPVAATAENRDQYLQTVLITANSPGKGFSQTGSTSRLNTNLEGGYLYAPFVQIMGRTGPELYLPFSSVSADKAQHVVPVADNSWGLNTSPDPGRMNVFDTKMSLNLNIAPPFVLPPA
jgi:hypothetical protein